MHRPDPIEQCAEASRELWAQISGGAPMPIARPRPFVPAPKRPQAAAPSWCPPRRVKTIVTVVAEVFGVSVGEMLSDRRFRNLTSARQVAAHLIHEVTARSLPQIGADLGGRDHTTILHALRVIPGKVANDEELAERVERIRERLEAKR